MHKFKTVTSRVIWCSPSRLFLSKSSLSETVDRTLSRVIVLIIICIISEHRFTWYAWCIELSAWVLRLAVKVIDNMLIEEEGYNWRQVERSNSLMRVVASVAESANDYKHERRLAGCGVPMATTRTKRSLKCTRPRKCGSESIEAVGWCMCGA